MTSTIPLTDSENSSGNIPIDVPDFVIRYGISVIFDILGGYES